MISFKSYTEMLTYQGFGDRLKYLSLHGLNDTPKDEIGDFYRSTTWRALRKEILKRDLGYDLAVKGCDIKGYAIIHHINPLTPELLELNPEMLYNPDNLVTVSYDTHNKIHYSKKEIEVYKPRMKGDTDLW